MKASLRALSRCSSCVGPGLEEHTSTVATSQKACGVWVFDADFREMASSATQEDHAGFELEVSSSALIHFCKDCVFTLAASLSA